MMFTGDQSILLVIDIQGNLAYRMHEKEALFKNARALIRAAQVLDIPIILTEQAPDKMGKTIPEIAEALTVEPIKKATFSCGIEEAFIKKLKSLKRKQIIVIGIEAR